MGTGLGAEAAQGAELGSAVTQGADLAAGAAQGAVESAAVNVPTYSWSGYFMGLAVMFLMLTMLWYGARWIKRSGSLRFFGMTPSLNVESRLSLGPRKHLLVVRYRGKRLLLGVTEHNINLLSEEPLDADELAGEQAEEGVAIPRAGISGKFKDILNDINKRK